MNRCLYAPTDRVIVSVEELAVHALPGIMPPQTKEARVNYRWVKKDTNLKIMSSIAIGDRCFYGIFVEGEDRYYYVYAHELHISTMQGPRISQVNVK